MDTSRSRRVPPGAKSALATRGERRVVSVVPATPMERRDRRVNCPDRGRSLGCDGAVSAII